MKQIPFVLLFVVWFSALNELGAQNKNLPENRAVVEVYYFHPGDRCPIDQSIEANTRKVMQVNFSREVRSGKILFRVIDTDQASNATLVSKFDINAQALYIVKNGKGKPVQKDLTRFAFDYGQSNPGRFKAGLIEEIGEALK